MMATVATKTCWWEKRD